MNEEAVTPSGQRILVPLDGSPLAELALVEALALAKLPNTELMLLQVIPPIEEVISIGLQEISLDQQWELQNTRRLAARVSNSAGLIWPSVEWRRRWL